MPTLKRTTSVLLSVLMLTGISNLESTVIHAADSDARIYPTIEETESEVPIQIFTYNTSPFVVNGTDTLPQRSVSVRDADETVDLRELAIERGLLTDTFAFPNHRFSLSDENEEMMYDFLADIQSKAYSRTMRYSQPGLTSVLNSGLCYGLTAATVLAHNGVISPSELQNGVSVLHDVELTDEVECIIGGYSVIQAYPKMNKYLGIQQQMPSDEEIMRQLLDVAERCEENGDYFMIGLQFPDSAHAVTGMGMVTGDWMWNDIRYDTCILVNDSNLVDADGNAIGFHEYGCIYVNSETLQFYIPSYKAGTEQAGNAIGFVIDDNQLLSYLAPLHGLETADVFEQSAGYVELIFYDGTMPKEVYVSKDGGETYEEILGKINRIGITGGISNAVILYAEGNAFYAKNDRGLDFNAFGDGYAARCEIWKTCEITLEPHQITMHNYGTETAGVMKSMLVYEDGKYEYSNVIAEARYMRGIRAGETMIFRQHENGLELISDLPTMNGYFVGTPDEVPLPDGRYVLHEPFWIAQSRALFTYSDEREAFEQYIDLDDDGVYETLIEHGDVNGNGTPFEAVDAQLALQDYAMAVSKIQSNYVNPGIADMDGDGKVTAKDAMQILIIYSDRLSGLV